MTAAISELRIEAMDPAAHAGMLFSALHGPDDAGLWQHLRDGPALSVAALERRLVKWIALPHVQGFVFHSGAAETVIGMGGLIRRDISGHQNLRAGHYVELAAVIFRKSCHGTGLARCGTQALIALALDNAPTVSGCLWRCAVENIASARFARKLGFRHFATGSDGLSKKQPRHSHFYWLDRDNLRNDCLQEIDCRAKVAF